MEGGEHRGLPWAGCRGGCLRGTESGPEPKSAKVADPSEADPRGAGQAAPVESVACGEDGSGGSDGLGGSAGVLPPQTWRQAEGHRTGDRLRCGFYGRITTPHKLRPEARLSK